MLSLFPQLLFLAPLAPFLLRLALAATLFATAWSQFRNRSAPAQISTLVECAIGGLLLVGIFTQLAAIMAAGFAIGWLIRPGKYGLASKYSSAGASRSTAWLTLAISLSLIVSGAGAFAFDLPL